MHSTTGPEMLRRWIERRDILQLEAAKEIGIDHTLLSHYLTRRRRPPLEAAIKIERTTGIPVEAWVSLSEDDSAVSVSTGRRNRR